MAEMVKKKRMDEKVDEILSRLEKLEKELDNPHDKEAAELLGAVHLHNLRLSYYYKQKFYKPLDGVMIQ